MTAPPYYAAEGVTLHLGDSLNVLPTLPAASIDAIVCDPPYELNFMGSTWDASGIAYNVDVWRECWRVLKPGGHLLAFGGTRTYHRMTVAIEDAGFEIRDSLHWIYGSGFPKSLDVSKAIDKAAGAQREVIGMGPDHAKRTAAVGRGGTVSRSGGDAPIGQVLTAPATADAARWSGFGTALKPSHEPIVLARKPLTGTVAATLLAHGTGALNIDGCRTTLGSELPPTGSGGPNTRNSMAGGIMHGVGGNVTPESGRWPTNILLGHGPDCIEDGGCQPGCPVAEMDTQSGVTGNNSRANKGGNLGYHGGSPQDLGWAGGDSGGASRFFPVFRYEAKAPASERPRLSDGTSHPTVKPLKLLTWLVRLVTPPGGVVLDPFAGSGTTLAAALREGKQAIGIERHEPYAQLAVQRLVEPYMVGLFDDIA